MDVYIDGKQATDFQLCLELPRAMNPATLLQLFSQCGLYGGFLKCWYPTTMGFPTKNDHFGVFWGYHHLRKHPYVVFLCLFKILSLQHVFKSKLESAYTSQTAGV